MSKQSAILVVLTCFIGLNIFLAFNRHSHAPRYTYHSELWADRAGYYVYLPATFEAGWDGRRFGSGLDTLTGDGFRVLDSGTIKTKYPCGVALLLAPFYLTAHVVTRSIGIEDGPFGIVDHAVVDIAAPALVALGLLLLYGLFGFGYSTTQKLISLGLVFFATNLFYYTVADPGMSHAYSFFLFAALMYAWNQWRKHEDRSIKWSLLVGVLAGLVVMVRPSNLLFVLIAPFAAGLWNEGEVLNKSVKFRFKAAGAMTFGFVLCLLPQIFYWIYAFGTPIAWSYGEEGFTSWRTPELAAFWFAPNNGLFNYTPFYALVIVGAMVYWRSRQKFNAVLVLSAFMVVSYLGASWWTWHFGCGFGSRTMVEYLALFAFPIAAVIKWSDENCGRAASIFGLVALVALNLKMTYSYGDCWFFETWDWQAFAELIIGPTK